MFFKEWLISNYLAEDSPEGDLARDVNADQTFPAGGLTLATAQQHLWSKGAHDDVVKILKRLWIEYRRPYVQRMKNAGANNSRTK